MEGSQGAIEALVDSDTNWDALIAPITYDRLFSISDEHDRICKLSFPRRPNVLQDHYPGTWVGIRKQANANTEKYWRVVRERGLTYNTDSCHTGTSNWHTVILSTAVNYGPFHESTVPRNTVVYIHRVKYIEIDTYSCTYTTETVETR